MTAPQPPAAELRSFGLTTMVRIPEQFLSVRYDASRFPGAPGVSGIAGGANCQQFAYELLRHFGYVVPDLRSSDLWEDTEHTSCVESLEPYDLVLFSADGNSFGAHVGVYLGDEKVIHLSKEAGVPEIRELAWFQNTPRYCTWLGAKRCRVKHVAPEPNDIAPDAKLTPAEIHAAADQVFALFERPCDSASVKEVVYQVHRALWSVAHALDPQHNQSTRANYTESLLRDVLNLHQAASALLASLLGSSGDTIADRAQVDEMVDEDMGDPAMVRAALVVNLLRDKGYGPVDVTLTKDERWLWTTADATPIGDAAQVRLSSLLGALAEAVASLSLELSKTGRTKSCS